MAGFGTAAAAAGSIIQAGAYLQQGKATEKLNDLNATSDRKKARDSLLQGRYTAQQISQQVAGILGGQNVGYAGQNVALDSGTPADVAADTARIGALDAITALNNAARTAYGFKVDAESASFQGKSAAYAGKLDALASLLGGAGQALS